MINIVELFKSKKSTQELIQEQYRKNFDEITEHYNGVRINHTLLGKIRSAKMDEITEINNNSIKVHSFVPRPVDFGTDVFAWLSAVKNEAKEVMNKLHKYKEEEKKYQEQLKQKFKEEATKKSHEFFVEYGVLAK